MASKNFKFSERLRSIVVDKLKWSYTDFAKRVKIHKNSATNYLEKGVVPEWDILLRICNELHVSADFLLRNKSTKKTHGILEIQKIFQKTSPDDQWHFQAMNEIFQSGETATIEALKANISQFYEKIGDKKRMGEMEKNIDNLKKEVKRLKNSISSFGKPPDKTGGE